MRATKPGLLTLAGTEASTSFLFLSCHAPRLASRSDTRRAALRPLQSAPVLVPPTCVGLPNRDADSNAPPPNLRWVHSEDQRARVEGPSEGRVSRTHATISRACVGCIRFVAHARRRSPPRRPSDIRCRRRATCCGRNPQPLTDRPRPSFHRHPAKGAGFRKTRMPSTVTTREGVHTRRDCSLRPSRRLSRSRRPHFSLC